jgi:hypothetical protein
MIRVTPSHHLFRLEYGSRKHLRNADNSSPSYHLFRLEYESRKLIRNADNSSYSKSSPV